MIKRTLTIGTISFLALGAVAMGCGEEGSDVETVTSALAGQLNVAFQQSNNFLVVDMGPNFGSNSNILMTSGTVPSQVALSGSSLEIGFRRNDGHFVVDQFTPPNSHSSTDSGGVTAGGTSPSLAKCPACLWAFGFQGANGHLWIGQGGSPFTGQDTGGAMQGGTSPSIAMKSSGVVALAFHGVNTHLWVGFTGPFSGFDTGGVMASGTSPGIAISPINDSVAFEVFQGANGHLWMATNGTNGFDTGSLGAMKAGTSPSVAIETNGTAVAAFQSSAGVLTLFTPPNSFTNTGFVMNNGKSPSIIATPAGGFQVNAKGSNGDLWIDLNGTFQDQGFLVN